jgi:hypothetical protein
LKGLPASAAKEATIVRQCFYTPEDQFVEGKGFVPSLVTEGEAGHKPLVGSGYLSEPWYWGMTYEQAKETCRTENARLGLSEADVSDIVASSISITIRQNAARERVTERINRNLGRE